MAGIDQNNARDWLPHSKTRPSSLKRRLLFRIGIVLAITWIVAAVFTKFLGRDSTRHFITEQSQHLAKDWISLIQNPSFSSILPDPNATSLLLGWRGDTLVLQQGPFILEKNQLSFYKSHQDKLTTIAQPFTQLMTIDNSQWLISSYCQASHCIAVGYRDTERRYAVRRLVAAIFLPLLFIFSIAMVAMYYAVNSGLRPLHQLTQHVSAVSADRLKHLPETNTSLELSPLVNALNQLMENIKQQLIKERKFLDTCAHELRTPVTALVAQIQSVDFQHKEADRHLHNIRLTANRTVRIANQLLGLAKTNNAEALENQEQTFDLCELIRQVTAELLIGHPKSECNMQGVDSLYVCADILAFEMLCRNIIDNALQYAKNQQGYVKILIDCQVQKSNVILRIEDSGQGIAVEHHKKVLQRFYRLPNKHHGAGLGLSIVNEVAIRYGGDVHIDQSPSLGGLSITVVLCTIFKHSE